MKKITVFAAVLAATALVGTSAAWAAPTPGTVYEVTGSEADASTSLTLACNSGDDAIDSGLPEGSTYPSPTSYNDTGHGGAVTTTLNNDSNNMVNGVTYSTSNTGGTLSAILFCVAGQAATTPPAPAGPGSGY